MEQKKTMEQIARENIDCWFKLLEEKSPEKMSELYAEDCTFLPTYSDEIITDRDGVKKYFELFMAMNPKGTLVSEVKGKDFSSDLYYRAGKYDFTTKPDGSDEVKITHARYDYTWIKKDGRWLIQHHQSTDLEGTKKHS